MMKTIALMYLEDKRVPMCSLGALFSHNYKLIASQSLS